MRLRSDGAKVALIAFRSLESWVCDGRDPLALTIILTPLQKPPLASRVVRVVFLGKATPSFQVGVKHVLTALKSNMSRAL